MNEQQRFVIVSTFMFIIVIVAASFIFVTLHEMSHEKVCRLFGARNITVENHVFYGRTYCLDVYDSEVYKLAQSNAESFGYNMMAFNFSLLLLGYFAVLVIGVRLR